MDNLESISFKDQKAIFGRLEQIASQANLTKEEREQYETEWKIYNDYFNTIESAEKKAAQEGREMGIKEEKLENARKMKTRHYPIEDICEITGLTPEIIEQL